MWVYGFVIIAGSLDVDVPYMAWLVAGICAEFSRWIPISFQGIGVREATFASVGGMVMGLPEIFLLVGAAGYAALTISLALSPLQAVHNFFES